jgi:dephospho-CoA kinase
MAAALKVGLTGGLAAGKSTVLAELKRLGAEVFDADAIVHELLAEPATSKKVARRFGKEVLDERGRVDRKALGAKVFGRPAELKALEKLLHPEVMRRMESGLRRSKKAVAVGDVPLLFEKGLEGRFDLTMTVSAPESAQLARLAARGMPRAEAKRRIKLHWSGARKEGLSDVVLDNAGPWKRVKPVVREYYKAFELLARGSGKR